MHGQAIRQSDAWQSPKFSILSPDRPKFCYGRAIDLTKTLAFNTTSGAIAVSKASVERFSKATVQGCSSTFAATFSAVVVFLVILVFWLVDFYYDFALGHGPMSRAAKHFSFRATYGFTPRAELQSAPGLTRSG
jgi:hypothetical protein